MPPTGPVDLAAPLGSGPLWGTASEDLNATLLAWPPDGGTPEHVNDERDVLIVVLEGSGRIAVDGETFRLEAQQALLVEKGRRRRLTASSTGIRYLSIHRRRHGLQISSLPAAGVDC